MDAVEAATRRATELGKVMQNVRENGNEIASGKEAQIRSCFTFLAISEIEGEDPFSTWPVIGIDAIPVE